MGPQYDICRDLSRTGPLFSTVFFQMGKVPYSHFRSPVRYDTAQSRVWEPCAHLARTPVGILEAPRGTRRPPEAPCRKSSGIYPGVTWCLLAAIRSRAAKRLRIARGSSVVWGSGGATLYLTDRERGSEAYVLHCALTPPGGERPGGAGKRPYGPDTPIWLLAHPALPLPPVSPTPPRPSHPSRAPEEVYKTTTVSRRSARKKTNRQTTAQERVNSEHITAS